MKILAFVAALAATGCVSSLDPKELAESEYPTCASLISKGEQATLESQTPEIQTVLSISERSSKIYRYIFVATSIAIPKGHSIFSLDYIGVCRSYPERLAFAFKGELN